MAWVWELRMRSRGTGTHAPEEPGEVLAIHTDARIRGAIHRSFAGSPQYDFVLAQSIDEARQRMARKRPVAIVSYLDATSLSWAADLHSRFVAPVVLCFSYPEADLCRQATALGLHHFVELPANHPSSWARHVDRISDTLGKAIADHRARTKGFAKSTLVMPAAAIDLEVSRSGAVPEESRRRRTTLVQEVSEADLEQARADETAASQQPTPESPSEAAGSRKSAARSARKAKRKAKRKSRQKTKEAC